MKRYCLKFTILIIVFPLASLLIPTNVHCASNEKPIAVIFLYDDVSSLSPIDIEVKLIDTFRHYNISCTFAVIPYVCAGEWRDSRPQDLVPLTPAKIDMMKPAVNTGVVEVVLHGYSHQTISKNGYGEHSEFACLDYQDQEKKIAKSRAYLEEILDTRLSTFYPTWNSYDFNTIEALQELGFTTIFGMEYGKTNRASTLNFLPFTCDLRYLRDALKSARRIADNQSVVVTLVRSSDLLDINRATGKPKFEEFVELIDQITSQKDIQVRSIDQTITAIEDLSAHRFLTYNSYLKLSHYTYPLIPPPFLNKLFPTGVYLSSPTSEDMKKKIWTFILSFYPSIFIISIIISFSAGLIISPRFRFFASIFRYGAPVGLVLLSIYALFKLNFSRYKLLLETSLYAYRHYYYKVSVLIVVLLGGCIGIWLSWIITGNGRKHV